MTDLLRPLETKKENVDSLIDMLSDSESRWYAKRRLKGFARAGLLASSLWNPDLHPRGPDGKFIEKWGWVRWLVDGMWQRGRVENLLPDGDVIVKPDADPENPVVVKTNRLYGLPTPKGKIINNPDPQSSNVPEGWEKTGEQGGSNPGGFFRSEESVPVLATPSAESVEQLLVNNPEFSDHSATDFPKGVIPEHFVATYTDWEGKPQMLIGLNGGADPTRWDQAFAAKDSRVFVTTSPEVMEGVRLTLLHGSDLAPGTQFYVKRTKSPEHSANEMLANEFYKLTGVPVPDLYFGEYQTVASKILTSQEEGGSVQKLSAVKDDPEVLRQIRQNMAVDAWLANWDVAGMTYDNIMVVDGIPYRIDTGGSLEYRAQGGAKGANFNGEANELTSLRSPSLNPSSAHIFADITPAELRAGGEKVAAISPKQIKNMVNAAGLSPSVADTLVARRAYIIDTLSLADPFVTYTPPKLYTVGRVQPSGEAFWNPLTHKWEPGILNRSAIAVWDEIQIELSNIWKSSDEDLSPTVGDTIVAIPGQESQSGMFRVTAISDYTITGVSALDDTNETIYDFHKDHVRVAEVSEKLGSLHLQYQVANENNLLQTFSLEQFFDHALINQNSDKLPITVRPYTEEASALNMWGTNPGNYIFHSIDDPDTGEDHKTIFKIKAKTDDSISMQNVVDGKERILTRDEWDSELPENWHVPDTFTNDLTDAALARDGIVLSEDQAEAVTLEGYPEAEVPGVETGETTAFNTSPIDPAYLETLGVSASMVSEDGINTDISVGESKSFAEIWDEAMMDTGIEVEEGVKSFLVDTPVLKEYIGQSVIVSTPDPTINFGYGQKDMRGLWFITDAKLTAVQTWGGEWNYKLEFTGRSPSGGNKGVLLEKNQILSSLGNQRIQILNSIDASVPQTVPNFKKNGDIESEGVVIGNHSSDYYGYRAVIFPKYSITGTKKSISTDKQYVTKQEVGRWLIPQLQPHLVEKSAKTKGSKEAILSAAEYKTRDDFSEGQWVVAPDGFVGKVDQEPFTTKDTLAHYPSAVKVISEDGKVRIINANLLVGIDAPEEVVDEPVPLSEFESKPLGPSPYYPLTYGDGNAIYVGQVVNATKGTPVTGTVTWATPPDGKQAKITPYAVIVDADGKKWKKALSAITLVKEADGAVVAKEGFPEHPKAAVEVAIDFTPQQIADVAVKYANPDGKTLAQPQWEKDRWLGGSPKRKLTKDGYAPRIGMRMRDRADNPLVVAEFGDIYKNPNMVNVLNLSTGVYKNQAVSALSVDQQAELGTTTGETIQSISGLTGSAEAVDLYLPDGSVIYRVSSYSKVYDTEMKSSRYVDFYFTISESGRIVRLTGSTDYISDTLIPESYRSGTIQKVAVIDHSAPHKGALSPGLTLDKPSIFAVYDPAEVSHEEALSEIFLEMTGVQVEGTEHPIAIPSSNLINLPKPADAPELSLEESVPDPPPVTGVVGPLDEKPEGIAVKSVVEGALEVASQNTDKAPGTGSEYAFGDTTYIEDMLVRSQIARDQSSGEVFVELHFKMPEDRAEATADKLLFASQDVAYGKWESRPELSRASELKKGDALSVRKSSMSDALKPSNGDTPNVRLVADPVLLGKDSQGSSIYRLTIASADGTTGAMDVQERGLASVKVFDWNPHAMITLSNSMKVELTPKAIKAGWLEVGAMGFEHNPSSGNISIDDTGAKLIQGNEIQSGASNGSVGQAGRRVHRVFEDGSYVRMNVVPSTVSGTSMGGESGGRGDIRRWNDAGLVTIRVPYRLQEDPEAFQASVSRAMEAVGIPPEAQGPATPEQIAIFALNKLYKTHSPDFKHREKGVNQADITDPGVTKVFQRMNKELAQYLGREMTLDDIEIRVSEDGRMQVVVSAEVAAAITKRQGAGYFRHYSSSFSDAKKVAEIIAGPNRGLMGGTERYSLGIFVTGASTTTDMTKGSGDRVYVSGRPYADKSDSNAFIFSPNAFNQSTDTYSNVRDKYGNRAIENRFLTYGNDYEYMVKSRIDVSQMAFFMANNENTRQEIITLLKAKGITEINGRPLEEFVVTQIPYDLDMSGEDFLKLGVANNGVSVADLLAAATSAGAGGSAI